MSLWIIILIIIVILFSLFIFISLIYNKFQNHIIRINEVESKIDDTLRNKYDNLLKINNIVKEKIKTDKEIIDDIEKIKSDEKTSFEMHRLLKEAYHKLDFVRKQYDELKKDNEVKELFKDIDDMDESLDAYIKYYNEKIVNYNEHIRKFPYNIMGKILKLKEKSFFDNKDLSDDNIKDFKI